MSSDIAALLERREKTMRRPNGTGSVYKLTDTKRRKPYVAAVTYYDEDDNYKLKKKVLGTFATKKEALLRVEQYNVNPYTITSLTFAQAFERWAVKGLEKGSQQRKASYRAAFKKCSLLHDMMMQDIKLPQLQAVFDRLAGSSKSTINNVKIVVSLVYEYCMKYEYINKDYSKYIELPEGSEKKKKQIFSDLEIKKLWDIQAKNDTAAIVLILIYTGYRINELLEMPKSNIKLNDAYIIGGGKKTKAGKDRIVPIKSEILPLIKCMLSKSKGLTFYDDAYQVFKKNFQALMSDLGMSHTIHETRHTFASLLDRAEVPESITKRLMGHSFGDITQDVYIHKELSELRKGIEKIKVS